MAFNRHRRSNGSGGHDEPSAEPAVPSTTDVAVKASGSRVAAGVADSDEFDLVGSRVAEILRKADGAAEDLRSEAEAYGARVYVEADSLRADAAEELAEAQRIRRRADLRLDQSETRLASIETSLEQARVQADELLASARRERDAIIEATVREAEDQMSRATRHLQARVKEIQRNQAEAG